MPKAREAGLRHRAGEQERGEQESSGRRPASRIGVFEPRVLTCGLLLYFLLFGRKRVLDPFSRDDLRQPHRTLPCPAPSVKARRGRTRSTTTASGPSPLNLWVPCFRAVAKACFRPAPGHAFAPKGSNDNRDKRKHGTRTHTFRVDALPAALGGELAADADSFRRLSAEGLRLFVHDLERLTK